MMSLEREWTTPDGENMVRIDEHGTIETYTRGTLEALYVGTDHDAAAASLEMSREDYDSLLMSDEVEREVEMTTYCNTDPKTPESIREKLNAIETALGDYATTADNPCGGAAYYDEGQPKPWRVLFCDGAACELFATAEEAQSAAEDYAEQMDSESE